MLIDACQYQFIYKRASFEVYKRYRINKLELWLLSALSGYFSITQRSIVSKKNFFGSVTGNKREISKMEGYCAGLLRLGCIATYEYIPKPGSVCIGITPLGYSVLECYREALIVFMDKYPAHPDSDYVDTSINYSQTA